MIGTDSRNAVLNRIREATRNYKQESDPDTDRYSEVFITGHESPEIRFVEEFQKVNGKFVFCLNENELVENLRELYRQSGWDTIFCCNKDLQNILLGAGIPFSSGKEDFTDMSAAFIRCEYLVARTGSIVVTSAGPGGRRMNIFPPVQIVLAFVSQIRENIDTALSELQERYSGKFPSQVSVITGPSRTADIEKTLVLGAHGPKEVCVLLVNDRDVE
ncbi:MAG: lactate utilization protein [Bacteroidetes bacterium]|nr:lactate utilization protein [Bacteroidota bacterium]